MKKYIYKTSKTIINKLIILGFVLLLPAKSTFAENIIEIYRLALMNDSDYQAAKYELEAATEKMNQAGSSLLPEIEFDASKSSTHEKELGQVPVLGVLDNEDSFETTNYAIRLTQPLIRYSSWLRYKQSDVIVQQAELKYQKAKQDLIMAVSEAYFAALQAQDNIIFLATEKAAVSKHLDDLKWRSKAGMTRESDLYDATARYAMSESKEVDGKNLVNDRYEALRSITSRYIGTVSALKDNITLDGPDPAELDEWLESVLLNNFSLRERELALQIARKEIEISKSEHYPTLDFVTVINKRDAKGSTYASRAGEYETKDYMVRFNMPIYSGGRIQSKMRETFAIREQLIHQVEGLRRQITRETRASYSGITGAIKKSQALNQALISKRRALDLKTVGFKAGVNTVLEVLDAQRDVYYAELEHSMSRYEFILDSLKLSQLAGSLSEYDLLKINKLTH